MRHAWLLCLAGCNLFLGIPEGELSPTPPTPDAAIVMSNVDATVYDGGWRTVTGTVVDKYAWESTDAGAWVDGGPMPPDANYNFLADGGPIDAGMSPPATGWRTETLPTDISAVSFSALIPRANAPDGFVVRTAMGGVDGSVSIPDVPEGPYYLKWTAPGSTLIEYYVLETSLPDLTGWRAGRPNRELATLIPTWLSFALNGIHPWASDDWFTVLIPALGAYWVYPYYTFTGGNPNDGWDAMDTFVGWHSRGRGLIRPGDLVYVSQLTPGLSSTGVSVKTLARIMTTQNVFIKNGGTGNRFEGRMSAVTKNQTVAISFRRAQFAAYEDAMSPAGNVIEWLSGVVADPMPPDSGQGTYTHDLVIFQVPGGSDDVDMGAVIYADPYPTSWVRYYFGGVTVQRPYLLPGATNPAFANAGMGVNRPKTASVAEITPIISPAQAPMLNGMDLMTDLTVPFDADSGPLVVSWTPPERGTADRYELTLYQLRIESGNTRFSSVARFRTSETHVFIPKDLITVPGIYFCYLVANDFDYPSPWEAQPRFTPPINSYAGLLTGMFTLVAPTKAGDAR